jgi:anti-sigma factor (TIGR02949 family)
MTDTHDHSDEITCEDVLAHLIEFLNGEVDAHKQAEIDHHLESCRGCYSRADFERVLKKRIKKAHNDVVPDSLKNRIDALLKEF